MQWHTQSGSITTNIKVEVNVTWPELSATNDVTCKCHVNKSAKGRYNMIVGRYLWTELWLNLKFYYYVVEEDGGPFKGSTEPMVDLVKYEFKYLNTGKITPKELFTNACTE